MVTNCWIEKENHQTGSTWLCSSPPRPHLETPRQIITSLSSLLFSVIRAAIEDVEGDVNELETRLEKVREAEQKKKHLMLDNIYK